MIWGIPLLQRIAEAVFEQHNAPAHVSLNMQDFFRVGHCSSLLWPDCSLDMSTFQHVWNYIGSQLSGTSLWAHNTTELSHHFDFSLPQPDSL